MHPKHDPGQYYGEVGRTRKINGLYLVESFHPAHQVLPWHAHTYAYCCLVLEGRWEERYRSRRRICTSHQVIFHPAGEVHEDHFREEAGRCFSIEFSDAWRLGLDTPLPVLEESLDFDRESLSRRLLRLYLEFQHDDPFSTLAIEGLVLDFLAQASRITEHPNDKVPSWLGEAREILHESFAEGLLISDLAQAVGIHPVYFARGFRKHLGCTPGEYVRRLRVEEACKLIAVSTLPLAQIAVETGFADQSHFTRTFKYVMGTTPSAYRKSLRMG